MTALGWFAIAYLLCGVVSIRLVGNAYRRMVYEEDVNSNPYISEEKKAEAFESVLDEKDEFAEKYIHSLPRLVIIGRILLVILTWPVFVPYQLWLMKQIGSRMLETFFEIDPSVKDEDDK